MGTQFKYVGPHDEVDVPALGLAGVKRGQVIETDDADVIGVRDKGKPLDKDGNANPDFELGSGLYAQPDTWEHVAPKKEASK